MHQDFSALCKQYGFTDETSVFERYLKPCIGFDLQPGTALPTGSSRLGGGPDLPSDFIWPINGLRALDFVLQVNLRDIAPNDVSALFPHDGVLTFFYDLNVLPSGYDPNNLNGYKVFLFPADTPLIRHRPSNEKTMLPEAAMRFRSTQTLPHTFSRIGERMMHEVESAEYPWSDDKNQAYWDLLRAVFFQQTPAPNLPIHRLGGHSHNLQSDMQLEAQMVMNGIYCGDQTGYSDPRRPSLEATCEE